MPPNDEELYIYGGLPTTQALSGKIIFQPPDNGTYMMSLDNYHVVLPGSDRHCSCCVSRD